MSTLSRKEAALHGIGGKTLRTMGLCLCLCAVGVSPAVAGNGDSGDDASALEHELLSEPGETIVEGGGAELLLFESMPVVVTEAYTASRQVVKSRWLSAPVSVLTAQDIHYGGLTRVPEMLRFVPGMEISRVGRNHYGLGVRGFYGNALDRRLVLIDGRAADDPVWGGGLSARWPLLPEDIQRIEVLRGPGGGVWGANAFTGAINIITKDPREQLGGMVSARVSHFGDVYTYLRYGEESGDWRYRVSAGFESLRSSEDAVSADVAVGVEGAPSNNHAADDQQAWRFSGKAVWEPTINRKVIVDAAHSHVTGGGDEFSGIWRNGNAWYELSRAGVRYERQVSETNSWALQWFGNLYVYDEPSKGRTTILQNDVEFQATFAPWQRHKTTVGGNFRWNQVDFHRASNTYADLVGDPFCELTGGGYVVHRWEPTDRLAFEGQFRMDWFSTAELDWSGRVAALYALDEQKNHILRLAAAKSFRVPMIANRRLYTEGVELMPGLRAFTLTRPTRDLHNEHTWAIEAGYRGRWADGLTFNLDAYVQRYEELLGFVATDLPGGMQIATQDNIDGSQWWGAECELTYTAETYSVQVWYAYNAVNNDKSNQDMRAYWPTRHKAGITGRVFLPDGWTFNANYQYRGEIKHRWEYGELSPDHRLDLTLSKKLFDGNAELMFGVSDLLASAATRKEIIPFTSFSGNETPG
ncbi:MAG: TonB-dependent receptor plug domain-containing protein, partial [Phycisphaerae bacterium]|nr:TonB-dependent receptor plug domain-containing protein [Phycisphaerae bacterium]